MLPPTLSASLQSRRTNSAGSKLNTLADFDSAMKSVLSKVSGGAVAASTPEAATARRNLVLVILGALLVLGFIMFPSVYGGGSSVSDPVRAPAARCWACGRWASGNDASVGFHVGSCRQRPPRCLTTTG
jgi:hypothetical protein